MSTPTRTRLDPQARRSQLLDLGVRLLATRSLDELSIDLLAEEAGVSRGLLYHYFATKADFHEAVVRRAADDLVLRTAPPESGEPGDRLTASMTAYLGYVEANHEGYVSLVRGAAGGNATLREIYEDVRTALTDRVFEADPAAELVVDTPTNRLLVRGWAAMCEDLVLTWLSAPGDVSREELLGLLSGSLLTLVGRPGLP